MSLKALAAIRFGFSLSMNLKNYSRALTDLSLNNPYAAHSIGLNIISWSEISSSSINPRSIYVASNKAISCPSLLSTADKIEVAIGFDPGEDPPIFVNAIFF